MQRKLLNLLSGDCPNSDVLAEKLELIFIRQYKAQEGFV